MSHSPTGIKWVGTNPGADVFIYLLLATHLLTTEVNDGTHKDYDTNNLNRFGAWGARSFAYLGIRKIVLSLKYTQPFTLNSYFLPDRNAAAPAWLQEKTEAIPAPTAGFTLDREWVVDQYADWKLEVANLGASQTTWQPTIVMETQRALA